MSDGEMRMEAAACAIVMYFAFLKHSQVCHGDQSLKVPEKSDLPGPHTYILLFPVILDSLELPMVTVYFHPWVLQKCVG